MPLSGPVSGTICGYQGPFLIVRCADQRSQQKNKAQALTVLRSRLLEIKVAEEKAKYELQRSQQQLGTGERSEKIRTYNFSQNRVTDHRIELTLYNLPAVLEGDLDPVIDPLMAATGVQAVSVENVSQLA